MEMGVALDGKWQGKPADDLVTLQGSTEFAQINRSTVLTPVVEISTTLLGATYSNR